MLPRARAPTAGGPGSCGAGRRDPRKGARRERPAPRAAPHGGADPAHRPLGGAQRPRVQRPAGRGRGWRSRCTPAERGPTKPGGHRRRPGLPWWARIPQKLRALTTMRLPPERRLRSRPAPLHAPRRGPDARCGSPARRSDGAARSGETRVRTADSGRGRLHLGPPGSTRHGRPPPNPSIKLASLASRESHRLPAVAGRRGYAAAASAILRTSSATTSRAKTGGTALPIIVARSARRGTPSNVK